MKRARGWIHYTLGHVAHFPVTGMIGFIKFREIPEANIGASLKELKLKRGCFYKWMMNFQIHKEPPQEPEDVCREEWK